MKKSSKYSYLTERDNTLSYDKYYFKGKANKQIVTDVLGCSSFIVFIADELCTLNFSLILFDYAMK